MKGYASEASVLIILNDYFKGTTYGTGRADKFTQRTPAAVLNCDNTHALVRHNKGTTNTYADT